MDKAEVLELSTTAYNDAALCLKRYDYRWNAKLVLKPSEVKSTMRRGTWIHRCLELIDNGRPWVPELQRMSTWALDHEVPEEKVSQLVREVADIVTDYTSWWRGHEEDPGPYTTWRTEVPLDWAPAPNRKIKATLDRVAIDKKGRYWIWERKSTGEIPDQTWRAVDPQTLFQYVVAREQGLPIVGIVFDYVLTEPGPAMRVKKDGRFYAGLEDKNVTSRAFASAEKEVRANWQAADKKGVPIDQWSGPDEYLNSMRMRMVNDGRWFQRYTVYRPEDSVMETMRDVAATMRDLLEARRTGHYRRSFNILTCRLFCPYGRVCMEEYKLGHPAQFTREELYVIDTPDIRSEGRSS